MLCIAFNKSFICLFLFYNIIQLVQWWYNSYYINLRHIDILWFYRRQVLVSIRSRENYTLRWVIYMCWHYWTNIELGLLYFLYTSCLSLIYVMFNSAYWIYIKHLYVYRQSLMIKYQLNFLVGCFLNL